MDIPSEFICPITMEIMVHPVATRNGQKFDRTALLEWMEKGSGECPLTRKPLKMTDLINDNFLAKKIRLWMEHNDVHRTEGNDKAESPDEMGEDDEVLVIMYGSTTNHFQLPTKPSRPHSVDIPVCTGKAISSRTDASPSPMSAASPRQLIQSPLRARYNRRQQHMWFF